MGAQASHCGGFSCCGAQVLGVPEQEMWHKGLVSLQLNKNCLLVFGGRLFPTISVDGFLSLVGSFLLKPQEGAAGRISVRRRGFFFFFLSFWLTLASLKILIENTVLCCEFQSLHTV